MIKKNIRRDRNIEAPFTFKSATDYKTECLSSMRSLYHQQNNLPQTLICRPSSLSKVKRKKNLPKNLLAIQWSDFVLQQYKCPVGNINKCNTFSLYLKSCNRETACQTTTVNFGTLFFRLSNFLFFFLLWHAVRSLCCRSL